MYLAVTRRQISCSHHHRSSFPASCFFKINLSCLKSSPRSPTSSTAHSESKATKRNVLKILQLLIDERIFTVLLPRDFDLALLLLHMLTQSLKRKLRPGNPIQPILMFSVTTCSTAGTVWGYWPQKADGSRSLEGCG